MCKTNTFDTYARCTHFRMHGDSTRSLRCDMRAFARQVKCDYSVSASTVRTCDCTRRDMLRHAAAGRQAWLDVEGLTRRLTIIIPHTTSISLSRFTTLGQARSWQHLLLPGCVSCHTGHRFIEPVPLSPPPPASNRSTLFPHTHAGLTITAVMHIFKPNLTPH